MGISQSKKNQKGKRDKNFQKMNFFQGNLARVGLDQKIVAAQYVEYAKEVFVQRFGEGSLEQARPVYVKQRALGVEVVHPAIVELIRKQEEGITSEINRKIGHPEIVRIICLLPSQRDEYSQE